MPKEPAQSPVEPQAAAPSHAAILGSTESLVKVRRALLSVSDKTDLISLAAFLHAKGIEILSTGGTATTIRDKGGIPVTEVADYTGFPEILDGRVKTLHPMVHGGLLGVRGNAKHETQMEQNGIKPIDMVVLNLYPFENTVAAGADFPTCVENIDIGGPSMLRSAAKNHAGVVIISSPSQYEGLIRNMTDNNGFTTIEYRRQLAAAAFALSARYDTAVAMRFANEVSAAPAASTQQSLTTRTYIPTVPFKYGCNPYQIPAALCGILENGGRLPVKVLNGTPGYINFLDATNAWQLVKELRAALGMPAAASFKHVSPAGAAVAVPLNEAEAAAYEIDAARMKELTPAALAYVRARNADPKSSFGDFAALSDVVDVATANFLKSEVSDGIIAPGFEPTALEILKAKKGGNFIVIEMDPNYSPPELEYRELYGMGFMQKRNNRPITMADLEKIVTQNVNLPDDAKRDLLLAMITLKYTQSNSVAYAFRGQAIGVGAGQQNRVDCVKLAGEKAAVWQLRQHPKVKALLFGEGVKRTERTNARVDYIEGNMTHPERVAWQAKFATVPEPLTAEEKQSFMATRKGIALASDAFFPFRDSIDHASKYGVQYVVQAGGSTNDADVTKAADEYGMTMVNSGVRLFLH